MLILESRYILRNSIATNPNMYKNRYTTSVATFIVAVFLAVLAQPGRARDEWGRGAIANRHAGLVKSTNRFVPPHAEYAYYPLMYPEARDLEGRFLGFHLHNPKGKDCKKEKFLFITYYNCNLQGTDNRAKIRCFFMEKLPGVVDMVYDATKPVRKFSSIGGYHGKLVVKVVQIVLNIIKLHLCPLLADYFAESLVSVLDRLKEVNIVGAPLYYGLNTLLEAFPQRTDKCQAKALEKKVPHGKNLETILKFLLPLLIDIAITTIPPVAPAGLALSAMPGYDWLLKTICDPIAEILAKAITSVIDDDYFSIIAELVYSEEDGKNDNIFTVLEQYLPFHISETMDVVTGLIKDNLPINLNNVPIIG